MEPCSFQSKLEKIEKNAPGKKILIFQETELSDSKIKKVLIFLEIEPCTFQAKLEKIKKKQPPQKFLIFREMHLFSSYIKKFQET